MLATLRKRMAALLEQRKSLAAERDQIASVTETRDATTEELAAFDAKRAEIKALDNEITPLTARIAELEADEQREAAASAAYAQAGQTGARREGGARVLSEPMAYGRGQRHSYFLDLARDQMGRGDGDGGVQEARARLRRHAQELAEIMPRREANRRSTAMRELEGIEGLRPEHRESAFERGTSHEQRANPSRVDGQGGYFVPPLWLIDEYIDLPRFGRQTANLCRNMPLPAGTDSINLPKIVTGSSTAAQTADNAAVSSTDMTDTVVTAQVRTIAGQEDVALQLLDQSPVSFDEILIADLHADYNAKLGIQVINGSGVNGQHLGILNVASINGITYTDASVTFPEMYPAFAQGASQIYSKRKMPATAAVFLPSTWYWATAQLDTTNRPLIVPPAVAWNSAGIQQEIANGDGPAGMLSMGLPAYMDGNMPSNLGAGANESRVIEARFSDLFLWEGALQTRVLSEVLSGTMQVRIQVYAYSAFMAGRRPEAISVVSGTGMIPQSGY